MNYHLDSNSSCYWGPEFLLYFPVSLQLNDLLRSSSHCWHSPVSCRPSRARLSLCSWCWFSKSWRQGAICAVHCWTPPGNICLGYPGILLPQPPQPLSLPLASGLLLFPVNSPLLSSLQWFWAHPLLASLKMRPLRVPMAFLFSM